MINIHEWSTLVERYPTIDGVCSDGADMEEWVGIRSQLIALINGWA